MMKKFFFFMLMFISASMASATDVTPEPTIYDVLDDDCVTIWADGVGEVLLYIDGMSVENPTYIERSDVDMVVTAMATAQEPGKEMSETYLEITIPAREVEPMPAGKWLILLDRNNVEWWYELYPDYNGGYTTVLNLYCYVYGFTTPYSNAYAPIDDDIPHRLYYSNNYVVYDARFCFEIDGVRYGPEQNYQECEAGNALANPLEANDNYFTMATGRAVSIGVAIDYESNSSYVYLAYAAYAGDEENFPSSAIKGDLDGDDDVSISDVVYLIDVILNAPITEDVMNICDLNYDGEVSVDDLTLLIDYLLNGSW